MQTSSETPSWMKQKLESDCWEKYKQHHICIIYADDTTLIAESEEELKSLWTRVKEKSENSGLKPNMENLRSGHPVSSLHGKQKEGKVEAVTDFLFGGLQNAHGW